MGVASGNIIEMHGLKKTYEIGSQCVDALKGIDLSIPAGTVAAITGRSGSGKSTLLHLVGALDRPTGGELLIQGQDVMKFPDAKLSHFRNRKVGFVFQMHNLLAEFSAVENVMMPGLIAGADKFLVKERAKKILGQVGLAQRSEHRPSELSGGEQQRVAIARALLMEPPILLADEPTGNLDKKNSHAIQELLSELCVTKGLTMLLVTHDNSLAERLPNQVVFEDGLVVDGGGFQ